MDMWWYTSISVLNFAYQYYILIWEEENSEPVPFKQKRACYWISSKSRIENSEGGGFKHGGQDAWPLGQISDGVNARWFESGLFMGFLGWALSSGDWNGLGTQKLIGLYTQETAIFWWQKIRSGSWQWSLFCEPHKNTSKWEMFDKNFH